MGHVVYLPEAHEDLFGIWHYVFKESESLEVADRLTDTIDDTCRIYADQPEMGQLRPDLAEHVRCFPVVCPRPANSCTPFGWSDSLT